MDHQQERCSKTRKEELAAECCAARGSANASNRKQRLYLTRPRNGGSLKWKQDPLERRVNILDPWPALGRVFEDDSRALDEGPLLLARPDGGWQSAMGSTGAMCVDHRMAVVE